MSTVAKQAQALEHGEVIIDPDGNEAAVIRVRWMDHKRCRLETDLGVVVVPLIQKFQVVQ
jgi:hypothetical protein